MNSQIPPGPPTESFLSAHTPPGKKHHWVRWTFVSIGAVVVLIIVLSVALGGKGSTACPKGSTAVNGGCSYGSAASATTAPLASAAATASPTPSPTPSSTPSPTPSPTPPPPTTLLSMSGNGIESSAPFSVTTSTVTATYTYSCASFGTSGNFIADMISGNPSSLSYDDQSIANALGTGGADTTTLYPQDVPGSYHLTVDSECDWTVTLTSG
jgi:hypothetical protein